MKQCVEEAFARGHIPQRLKAEHAAHGDESWLAPMRHHAAAAAAVVVAATAIVVVV